jgi:cardiolipin synthase A/B
MNPSTKWDLYASNEDAWAAMLKDCSEAKESILLEQFIFYNDDFGQKLLDIFIERAQAGVKVKLLWDAAGSFSLFGSDMMKTLRKHNIELVFWRTLIPSYYNVPNIRSWFFRNHRRTLVIDGRIGYTGSICIKDSMKNWRDTNVRLEGTVVHAMEDTFNRMWARAKGFRQPNKTSLPADPAFSYVTNSPAPGRRHLYHTLVEALRSATKYIYITTPYFVPTHRLIRVIKLAAHRGVDVRIIIPKSSDIIAVDLGARSYFDTLLESGARIFLYHGELIHSKTVVVDGTWASVGSLNFDAVSLRYNYEANIVSLNSKFAEELAAHFVHDLQSSREVTLQERQRRLFLEKLPEFLIKLVRNFL